MKRIQKNEGNARFGGSGRAAPAHGSDADRGASVGPLAQEAIARRAYELHLERGAEPGHEIEDWFRAEAELRGGHQ